MGREGLALLVSALVGDSYAFGSREEIVDPVSLEEGEDAAHLLDEVGGLPIADFSPVVLQPLLEAQVVVVEDSIDLEQAGADVDVVLEPVPAKGDEVVVGVAAVGLQLLD